MSAQNQAFWHHLDAQIASGNSAAKVLSIARLVPSEDPLPVNHEPVGTPACPGDPAAAESCGGGNWAGILDTISTARDLAQQREERLRDHGAARDALEAELVRMEQELQVCKLLLEEVQLQAEAKAIAIQTTADERVSAVEARAQIQLREAQERIQLANQRADVAESWLGRIEQASKDLLNDARRQFAGTSAGSTRN